jgi:hypothetical protein
MPAQYYFDELDPVSFQRLINGLLVKRYGEGIRASTPVPSRTRVCCTNLRIIIL